MLYIHIYIYTHPCSCIPCWRPCCLLPLPCCPSAIARRRGPGTIRRRARGGGGWDNMGRGHTLTLDKVQHTKQKPDIFNKSSSQNGLNKAPKEYTKAKNKECPEILHKNVNNIRHRPKHIRQGPEIFTKSSNKFEQPIANAISHIIFHIQYRQHI